MKFEVVPGFESRYQHWKNQVSPGSTETLPVGRGRLVRSNEIAKTPDCQHDRTRHELACPKGRSRHQTEHCAQDRQEVRVDSPPEEKRKNPLNPSVQLMPEFVFNHTLALIRPLGSLARLR